MRAWTPCCSDCCSNCRRLNRRPTPRPRLRPRLRLRRLPHVAVRGSRILARGAAPRPHSAKAEHVVVDAACRGGCLEREAPLAQNVGLPSRSWEVCSIRHGYWMTRHWASKLHPSVHQRMSPGSSRLQRVRIARTPAVIVAVDVARQGRHLDGGGRGAAWVVESVVALTELEEAARKQRAESTFVKLQKSDYPQDSVAFVPTVRHHRLHLSCRVPASS
jgi:hypothetical protein